MTAQLLSPEMNAISRRTRRMLGVSLAVHVVLLLLLALYKEIQPEAVTLTEITWIEPGPGDGGQAGGSPSPPPQPAQPPTETPGISVKSVAKSEQFVRDAQDGDYEPEPQQAVTDDRIAERLAVIQRGTARPAIAGAVALPGPVGLATLSGTGTGSGPGGSGSSGLNRGSGSGGGGGRGAVTPLEMKRSGGAPAPAIATIVPDVEEKPAAPKRSSEGVVAQRTLQGATLLGPVADRRLIKFIQPRYPDWAKKEGVEAVVRIYFVVLENGYLKENVVVQKTSGYQDFDTNAIEALRGWRFEPLPSGSAGEQWGEITFRYRLSGGSAG
jgi:TonB family protein